MHRGEELWELSWEWKKRSYVFLFIDSAAEITKLFQGRYYTCFRVMSTSVQLPASSVWTVKLFGQSLSVRNMIRYLK